MNKKTYIQPNTIVMLMETACCLNTASMETDTNEENGVSDEKDVLARKNFSIWDDEE